jgi:hypothetical protein
MPRPLVHGYVGLGAIPAKLNDDRTKTKVLIAIRDHIEEQLEREHDVCAQLAIACEGRMEIGVVGEIDEALLSDLRALAERSLREFNALRLNACLKELELNS